MCRYVKPILERLDLAGFALPLTLDVRCASPATPGTGVICAMWVRDSRNSGRFIPVENHVWIRGEDDERTILCKVRDGLLELVRHELLEQIKLDGRRIFDPHSLPPPTFAFTPAPAPPPAEPAVESPPPARRTIPALKAWATMTVNAQDWKRLIEKSRGSLDKRPAKRFNRQR